MLSSTNPTPDQWDSFVRSQPRAHFMQLTAWGELKSAYEWDVHRVILTDHGRIFAGAQLLFRRLPFLLGSMAYLPMGPYHTPASHAMERGMGGEDQMWQFIDSSARDHGAAFLKWEPGIYLPDETPPDFAALAFRHSPQTVQPPRTVLIDISGDDEAILARMNQGTRRKIRQSQKGDVRYYEGSRADVAKFTAMMQSTGARNEFGVHEPRYYELAYDLFVPKGDAALILAENEGDPLAGIMVFAVGQTAWYVYGASSNIKRNLMASYGVQWAAIQWAKARGCTIYDMWGVPDADFETLEAQFETRSDGLWGVYGFKRGWGGEVVRSLGAWDKVYNSLIYGGYKLALKMRE